MEPAWSVKKYGAKGKKKAWMPRNGWISWGLLIKKYAKVRNDKNKRR